MDPAYSLDLLAHDVDHDRPAVKSAGLPRERDIVDLYFDEMGAYPTLGREQEVQIARAIEHARQRMLRLLLELPLMVDDLARLGEDWRRDGVRLEEVLLLADETGAGPRPPGRSWPREIRELLEALDLEGRAVLDAQARLDEARADGRGPDEQATQALLAGRDQMVELLCRLRLRPEFVDRIRSRLEETGREVIRLERGLQRGRRTAPNPAAESPAIALAVLTPADESQRARSRLDEIARDWSCETDCIRSVHKRARKLRAEEVALKNRLIQSNLRLVVSIAKRYMRRGLPFPDILQEGNLGLMKAVDKFDYLKGYRFSTYATWWIQQSIIRAIAEQGRTIRIPLYVSETLTKMNRVSQEVFQESHREPTIEELALLCDKSVDHIRLFLESVRPPYSLEGTIGDDDDSQLAELVGDPNAACPHDQMDRCSLQRSLLKVIETLTEREQIIIKMRFGVGFSREHTLEEIGNLLGLTRERIRQIEASALRRLREPAETGELQAYCI